MEFKKGFTLIELLVVIAIIGLLASIILVSLNTARAKSRDARRVSDLRQVTTALELYYEAQTPNTYPITAAGCSTGNWKVNMTNALSPNYMSAVPIDPSDGLTYYYAYSAPAVGGVAQEYALRCRMEQNVPAGDIDLAVLGCTAAECADPYYCISP